MDPYQILGVSKSSTQQEIKSAYRKLAKKYHPDKGGNKELIIKLNAAWEILKDIGNTNNNLINCLEKTKDVKSYSLNKYKVEEINSKRWLKTVYAPIDKLLGQIINKFQRNIKDLSADPYDDELMESFCNYIEDSKKKIKKINELYRFLSCPKNMNNFSTNLFQCISIVDDAINEIDLYSRGYVDEYLHDGQEMIRKARNSRDILHSERKNIPI